MTNRRDFIKWVLAGGVVALLPAETAVAYVPRDVLEGICCVGREVVCLLPMLERAGYMAQELAAFERCMQDVWANEHGSRRYVRAIGGWWLRPEHDRKDPYSGEVTHEPEAYEIHIQYRKG